MKCPLCAHSETKVVDSRLNQTRDIIRRRRGCLQCEGRFTTYERVEEVMPLICKKDGRREPFSRDKIVEGIQKACQKRAVPMQKIEDAVNQIEQRVRELGMKEVPAKVIGELVMSELHSIDKVAYIRFASVYREFRDVEEFVSEIKDAHPAFPFTESELDQ